MVRPVPLDADGLLPLNIHTFDIDTFILEDSQIKRVDLLDVEKRPYLSLTFTAPVVAYGLRLRKRSVCLYRTLVWALRPGGLYG